MTFTTNILVTSPSPSLSQPSPLPPSPLLLPPLPPSPSCTSYPGKSIFQRSSLPTLSKMQLRGLGEGIIEGMGRRWLRRRVSGGGGGAYRKVLGNFASINAHVAETSESFSKSSLMIQVLHFQSAAGKVICCFRRRKFHLKTGGKMGRRIHVKILFKKYFIFLFFYFYFLFKFFFQSKTKEHKRKKKKRRNRQ